jgi:hypothetical protein
MLMSGTTETLPLPTLSGVASGTAACLSFLAPGCTAVGTAGALTCLADDGAVRTRGC